MRKGFYAAAIGDGETEVLRDVIGRGLHLPG
jgi:hypothetical protein